MAHDVFISYSTKDGPAPDAVCRALESAGVRCWVAPRDVAAGASYAAEIVRAIPASRVMVLVFSAAANDSEHVKREVERAAGHKVPLIPFRIEDVQPAGEMEYFISRCQWVDAFDSPPEEHLGTLVRAVQGLLRSPVTTPAPPPATPVTPPARPVRAGRVPGFRGGLSFRPGARSVGFAGSLALCLLLCVALWPRLPGHGRHSGTGQFVGPGGSPGLAPPPPAGSVGQARMEKRFDLMNETGVRLVRVEPGEFRMGSPPSEPGRGADERPHRVRLTRPFLMSIEEVTRGQFGAFVAGSGYQTDAEREGYAFQWSGKGYAPVYGATWRKAGYDQDDSHPVVNVSWRDAAAFCDWLSARGAGREGRYRLPTEAEWEYACRAGAETAFAWGDAPGGGAGWCNAADRTAGVKFPGWAATFDFADGFVFTAPAGSFSPNRWGLYDSTGNVSEWCSDWYDGGYAERAGASPGAGPVPGPRPADAPGPVADPTGPPDGAEKSLRGGSWGDGPSFCRAAARRHHAPDYRSFEIGFRVVLEARAPGTPATITPMPPGATPAACSRPATRAAGAGTPVTAPGGG